MPLLAAGYSGRVLFGDVPVPGATVVASRGDRHVSTVTDDQGAFTFADLEEGAWTIRVEMLAFAPLARDVTVGPDVPASEWKLALKPMDELTRESTQAPPPAASPASAAPTGAAASRPPTTSVGATASRPATATARPAAAVSPAAGTGSATRLAAPEEPQDPTSAATSDGLVINGSVNNAAASQVAQPAAFGNNRRQSGALYNGSAAFIGGSSMLDARPFAISGASEGRPDYSNLKFVGTFGGPLKFSRTPNRNPTVFVSFQYGSDHSATTQFAVMPTAAERAGDFSRSVTAAGLPVQPRDPDSGQLFDGGIIPEARISRQAAALLQYFPQPTIDGASGFNFQAPLLSGTRQDLLSTRIAQALSANNQLIGLLSFQRSSTDQTTLFGFTDGSRVTGIDTSVSLTHRFNQSRSIRLRYQFVRLASTSSPYFANRVNVSGDAGITGNDQDPANWGPPSLQFSTVTGLTDALPAATRSYTHSGGAEMYWTRGHHNLTLGGDGREALTDVRSQLNPRGSFTFTGAVTGSDFADFLLGLPSASSIAFGNADKDFRASSYDAYLTDDWRFSPTLTMQVGARWEYETPPRERLGRLVNLDVAPDFRAVAPVQAGAVGSLTGQRAPDRLMRPDFSGFQPRLALAWRPIVGSSLLVRAGYGVYRNAGLYQPITTLLAQQPPLSTAFTVSSSAAAPLSLARFSAPAAAATNTFGVDPDLRVGRSQNWQLFVQRDLFGFLTWTASYLGTKGDHLLREFLPNTYPIGAANPCVGCPSGFVYLVSNGRSSRHAGQWQLRWRLHRGLAASVQYTLATARDNAGAFTGVSLGGSAIAQDWRDLDGDEARSNFDQRHQVVAQAQYTTGVGLGGGGMMDGAAGRWLGGWTITSQLNTGSGMPFTPVYLAPVQGTGVVGTLRPSFTGASVSAPAGHYLNPAAYTAPAPGEWGDVPRNSVTGPRQFAFDLGVARTFQWTRRLSFDWRIDATNVFNRRIYTGVNAVLGSPQFGLPNGFNTPRRLLSTMRLRF